MKGQLAPKMATKHREIMMIFQFISSYTSWNIYLMIQRIIFIRLHVEHFFRPWVSPCLILVHKGMHFQSMEAELDELLDKAQSIPQKVLGQARGAPPIFWATYPQGSWGHPNNWWKVRESLPNPLISGLGVVGLGLRHVSDGLSNEGGRERF